MKEDLKEEIKLYCFLACILLTVMSLLFAITVSLWFLTTSFIGVVILVILEESIKGHTLRHLSKLRKFLRFGDSDLFHEVDMETLDSCTRACSYCPRSKDKVIRIMNQRLFYNIIDELEEINYRGVICLSNYGEPLMDDRLEQFISYISEKIKYRKLFFHTNGDLLTIERFRNLIRLGVSYIYITQHNNISESLKEFFKQTTEEDKKHIRFKKLNEDSVLSTRGGSIKVKNKRKYSGFCRSPLNILTIRASGIVCLCCNDYYNKVVQGDLNKQSIKEIWNNPLNKKRREDISKGIITENICKVCIK